jgi:hypothetical protein
MDRAQGQPGRPGGRTAFGARTLPTYRRTGAGRRRTRGDGDRRPQRRGVGARPSAGRPGIRGRRAACSMQCNRCDATSAYASPAGLLPTAPSLVRSCRAVQAGVALWQPRGKASRPGPVGLRRTPTPHGRSDGDRSMRGRGMHGPAHACMHHRTVACMRAPAAGRDEASASTAALDGQTAS